MPTAKRTKIRKETHPSYRGSCAEPVGMVSVGEGTPAPLVVIHGCTTIVGQGQHGQTVNAAQSILGG